MTSSTHPNKKRAVLIGLDGATFDVIDPLVAQGRLPHLARLMREGTRAPLDSSVFPNSFPGWTCAATGVNEGKHGIFTPLVRGEDNFRLHALSARDVRAKPLWELLSERGLTVGVLNDPVTYPPAEVNGFLVSGMLCPSQREEYTWPRALKRELESLPGGYTVDVNLANKSRQQVFSEFLRSIDQRVAAIKCLWNRYDWDLLWIVFTESDRVQHRFWAADDTGDRTSPSATVLEIYERLDAAVGELLGLADGDENVFVVSDHGFGPWLSYYDVRGWLIERGYQVMTGGKARIKSALDAVGLGKPARAIYHAIEKLTHEDAHGPARLEQQARSIEDLYAGIDWSQTRAYFAADSGIRLNLKGREPHGIVEPGEEEEKLKAELKRDLASLTYPNGAPVFSRLLLREEAYSGPFVERAADIVLPIDARAYAPTGTESTLIITDNHNTGEHTTTGIFIACGPDIEPGAAVGYAALKDVAPTLLYALDQALTEEMDGRPLVECFGETVRSNQGIRRNGTSYRDPAVREKVYTEDEERLVEERLKELGYF